MNSACIQDRIVTRTRWRAMVFIELCVLYEITMLMNILQSQIDNKIGGKVLLPFVLGVCQEPFAII